MSEKCQLCMASDGKLHILMNHCGKDAINDAAMSVRLHVVVCLEGSL